MRRSVRHRGHSKWILKHLFSLHRTGKAGVAPEKGVEYRRLSEMPLNELFRHYKTSENGLHERDIDRLRKKWGQNEIISDKPHPWYTTLFHNFSNPFVLLLLALSGISFILHNYQTVTIILVMVFLGVIMRFIQEMRSEKAFSHLKSLVTTKATVIRDNEQETPLENLVPGDIVTLSAGDMIPADLRIISAHELFISQSSFTGEAFGIEKCGEGATLTATGKRVFDLPNICLMGTNVVSGIAKGIVIQTGRNTYLASIAEAIVHKHPLTNFDIGINKVSWLLIQIMACMTPVVFVINGLDKGDWFTSLLFSLSVAVGLTPEMLPMIVTATLAQGALRMSKSKVIVKQLSSIQNFGAIDILCTDKTGTLTQDQVVLERYINLEGDDDEQVLQYAFLNSTYQSGLKNLLDQAILKHPFTHNETSVYTKVDEIPFDFTRKRMSVIVSKGKESNLLIMKGAFYSVASVVTKVRKGGIDLALSEDQMTNALQLQKQINNQGMRTLACAIKEVPIKQEYHVQDEEGMTLVGILTFLDPPKLTSEQAIKALMQYGVNIKVLTGDDALVTKKVCEWVKLSSQRLVTGQEFSQWNEEEKENAVETAGIFAELAPLQKAEIVALLRKQGHSVGFLGDGINDAAALREADVGISVDSAVDIAKESSDIVMLEKDLMFLKQGVIEGRKTFANTLKYIKMAISSNFGNVFSILGASLLFPFLPMLPLQILTQNLLYDLSQLAIPFDRVDSDFIEKPKSWNPKGILKFMVFLGPLSSIFDYLTFGVLFFYFGANTIASQSLFQTGWFVEGLCSQVLIVHMLRTAHLPFIQSFPSPFLLISTLTMMAIGIFLPYSHTGLLLGMQPLPLEYFFFLAPIIVLYMIATQVMKFWFIRRFQFWL